MAYNILHFSQDFRKDKGQLGAYSRIFNLTRDGNSHIIFTVHFGDFSTIQFQRDHLEIISLGLGKEKLRTRNENLNSLQIGRRILDYIKKNEICVDLLFGHAQPLNFKILWYLKINLNKKLVWDVNTLWGMPLFEEGDFLYHLYLFFQGLIAYRICDHLIAQTEGCKRILIKNFWVSSAKISVITNSVNFSKYQPPRKYEHDFKSNNLNIFFIGRFDELNGFDFLLKNLYLFNKNKIVFHFVGIGQDITKLEKLHQAGMLIYHGTIPQNEMYDLLKNADLLLIPRINCFGSNIYIPTKLLEGMAMGLIVLGSNVGGINEVIQNNVNGYLFKPDDPVDMVNKIDLITNLKSEQLNNVSSKAVSEIFEFYNADENTKQINKIFSKLVI